MGGRFAGRVAIVTGASTDPGIGRSCALRLGRDGAQVVINARSADALESVAEELRALGIDVLAVPGSVLDDEVPDRLVAATLDRFGRLDYLVNTVGGLTHAGRTETLDRASLLASFDLNVWPALALVQAAMRRGLADGGGAVVNISSGSPNKATPTMASYAAAKAALNQLTRTLAHDLAPDVRVNAVSPGLTRTNATREAWVEDDGAIAASMVPLQRFTGADDIAAAVAFLLSDDAAAITGVLLDVDGGNHLASGGWTRYGGPPTS